MNLISPSLAVNVNNEESVQSSEQQGAQIAASAANTFPGVFNRCVRGAIAQPNLPYATYRPCKSGNSYPTANGEFTVVNDQTKRANTYKQMALHLGSQVVISNLSIPDTNWHFISVAFNPVAAPCVLPWIA